MAWGTTAVTTIRYGSTDYHFAPTELVYLGTPSASSRQFVQTSESGIVKIQEISSNDDAVYEFVVRNMPAADRTFGALTIRGFTALTSLVKITLNYRENICELAPTGTDYGSRFDARYWGDNFAGHKWISQQGTDRYGDGTSSVIFRAEI